MTLQEKSASASIALFGALIYGLLAAGIFQPDGYLAYGDFVYNYYLLTLLDGRLDIPVRIIGFEGVYDQDGRAYGYYGLAPLLTRLLAIPFVELREVSLSAATICLFAIAGSAVYQYGVVKIAIARIQEGPIRLAILCLSSIAIWIASPGLLLASNTSFYHEPISASYFGTAGVLVCLALAVFCGKSSARLLIPSAIFMAFCIHGRPQVALGLSPALIGLLIFAIRESGFREIGRMSGAFAIFLAAGVSFIAMQTLTHGNPLHQLGIGKSTEPAKVYGFSFWQIEPENSPRWAALAGTGKFNAGRILPATFLYAIDRPEIELREKIRAVYRGMTKNHGGVRVERPRYGFVYLWAPWLLLILFALPAVRQVPVSALWLLVPGILSAIATLSYGTITHRYQVDVWPLVVAPGLIALAVFGKISEQDKSQTNAIFGLVALGLLYASHMNYRMAQEYSAEFPQNWLFATWPEEACLDFAVHKGFTLEHARKTICTLP